MTYAQREAELDAIAAIITKNDGRSLDQVDDIPIQGLLAEPHTRSLGPSRLSTAPR